MNKTNLKSKVSFAHGKTISSLLPKILLAFTLAYLDDDPNTIEISCHSSDPSSDRHSFP